MIDLAAKKGLKAVAIINEANILSKAVAEGARALTVILLAQDRPRLVLGSVGGYQQTQALQQVLVRHLVDGLTIQDAIEAPRWALTEDATLQLEPGLAALAVGLAGRGHRVGTGRGQFGACHAIRVDPETGALHGVADPRIVGAALGY